jgi:hypothetical protein
MVAEIEADMAAQLARVREMERNGELEPCEITDLAGHPVIVMRQGNRPRRMLADRIDVRADPLSDMSVLTGVFAMKGERVYKQPR